MEVNYTFCFSLKTTVRGSLLWACVYAVCYSLLKLKVTYPWKTLLKTLCSDPLVEILEVWTERN